MKIKSKSIIHTRVWLALALVSLCVPFVRAQEEGDERVEAQFPVWRAELPGGSYLVKLAAIDAVSMHTYVVDGAVEVQEVVVSTPGVSLARFYSMRRATVQSPSGVGQFVVESVQERIGQAAERFGAEGAIDSTVVKSYPATTHAKTVEYRLGKPEDIERLFASLRRAWLTGRGSTFTLKSE